MLLLRHIHKHWIMWKHYHHPLCVLKAVTQIIVISVRLERKIINVFSSHTN